MKPAEYYEKGDIVGAVAASTELVKNNPTDIPARSFLCEMLCFAGAFERVDAQLETISKQDAKAMVGVSLFRQIVQAEQHRQDFYAEGRAPEFLVEPAPHIKMVVEASIAIREGESAKAAELLARVEEERPKLSGTCNGEAFEDVRDLDDVSAPFLEVLTSTGKYFWAPFESIESIEFTPPERPRDLIWREAHLIIHGGPDGNVYIPALYPGTCREENDNQLRLGRGTEWRGADGEPVRGFGQRTLLFGEKDIPILELREIEMEIADAPAPAESTESTDS